MAEKKPSSTKIEFNVQNEQVIVSSLLKDAAARSLWCPQLEPDEFVGSRHRVLLSVAREMDRQGLEYAEDTVEVLADGQEYGGVKYLRELMEAYELNPNLPVHVERLRKDTRRHAHLLALHRAQQLAEDPAVPEEELEAALHNARLLLSPTTEKRPKRGREIIDGYLYRLYNRPGLFPIHFKAVDERLVAGLAPKKVSVVAGRPGMGKSTFCANIVLRQARRKRKTLVLPVERGEDSLIDGMICARLRWPLEKIVKDPKNLGPDDRAMLEKGLEDLFNDECIEIYDQRWTLDEMESKLVNGDYSLVLVDLWEKLLKNLEASRIAEALNRTQSIAHRARRGEGAHIMIFHQVRRGTEKAKNHRPTLEMLKNSGGYEEVADLILLLHREKYYEPTLDRDVIEVHCAKQTQGATGWAVGYEFHGAESRVGAEVPDWFEELDALIP